MTLAQINAILKSHNETPEGKAILILQMASVNMNIHANQLLGGAFNKHTVLTIADAMLEDAETMIVAAKAAATAPSKPTI